MKEIVSLGIDLAKNVFQLHGVDRAMHCVLKKRLSRTELSNFIVNLPVCKIYMEACGSANYWGRKFIRCGHEVKLIDANYVKIFAGSRNKNDAIDAEAIVVAASQGRPKFVEIRGVEQQDIQSIHRIRSRLIKNRTALGNQIRGLLAEYGITISQGIEEVRKRLPGIIADTKAEELSKFARDDFRELYEEFVELDKRIERYEKKIKSWHKNNDLSQRLATIPGVGALTATILAGALGTGTSFKNGRHFAAWLGLTPRHRSSGEKSKMLGISKQGDGYIRSLLVHGSRSVIMSCNRKSKSGIGWEKSDKPSKWTRKLFNAKGWNITAVALANKRARIAWAIARSGGAYDPEHQAVVSKKAKAA